MPQKLKNIGAMVLGMHDAIVSLTGMITGLAFALADNGIIMLSAIIASVAASLSMGASNYLAEKTIGNPRALAMGTYTGLAYVATSALLIFPFALCTNHFHALMLTFAIAILIIFLFNFCVGRIRNKPWRKDFFEMTTVCAAVSIAAFLIGCAAKYFLGVDV